MPERDLRKVAMTLSLVVSALMLGGKLTAYALTHSAALLADVAESVVHGVATLLSAYSLWYAGRPADPGHPYGHGRIAYFSVGFEGALVFGAACAVLYSGIHGLLYGVELRNLDVGLLIAAVLAAINLVLGTVLIHVGRRHNTLVLIANGKHVLTDVWTTAAALVGLGLVRLTGVQWLDPAAAIAIAGIIMISGLSLLKGSFAGLMDQVSPQVTAKLVEALRRHVDAGDLSGYHQLRCRRLNDELWVDVHLLVPGEITTHEAHDRATRLEETIRAQFPQETVHIMTHIEPEAHDDAHPSDYCEPHDPLIGHASE